MAMSKDTLGLALWTAVKSTQSFSPAISGPDDAKGLAVWTVVADEVIKHVIANAVVTVPILAGTVTTGPGAGGVVATVLNTGGKVTA